MPLVVQVPRNRRVAVAVGGYSGALRIPDRRNGVENTVRRDGLAGYEPTTQAVLLAIMQRAPRGAVVFDVGAHIGIYPALLATVYRSRGLDIFAFEPTPTTQAICQEIRDRNHLEYEIVPNAVSDEPGTAELYLSHTWDTSNSLNAAHREATQTVTVEVTTLDAFSAARGRDPYLLKIDVETYEPQVLRGAFTMIERSRPWITCELLGDVDRATLAPCLERLQQLGYRFHRMCGMRPWPAYTAAECLELLDNTNRDWLIAPQRQLTPRFYQDVGQWLLAITECDSSTNTVIRSGEKLPPKWNRRFDPTSALGRTRRRLVKAVRNPSLVASRLREMARTTA